MKSGARQRIIRRTLSSEEQRDERARGSSVMNYAAPCVGEAGHLPEPVADDFFQLRERGARLPGQSQDAEARAKHVAKNARELAVGGEIAEEARMLPVRQPRNDDLVHVAENCCERLPVLGRR